MTTVQLPLKEFFLPRAVFLLCVIYFQTKFRSNYFLNLSLLLSPFLLLGIKEKQVLQ